MAAIIGLIVCAVSGVMCIVGLAIPYWAVNAISDSVHYGLWTGCNAVMCLDYGKQFGIVMQYWSLLN